MYGNNSHMQNHDGGPPPPHEGIITLVCVIRAVTPPQVFVGVQPMGQGWRAVALVMGTELRYAMGANPEAAALALYDVLLEDARRMRAALDRLITRLEGDSKLRTEVISTMVEEPASRKPAPKKRAKVEEEEEDEDDE